MGDGGGGATCRAGAKAVSCHRSPKLGDGRWREGGARAIGLGGWRGKKPGNGEKGVVLGLFHQKDPKTGFRLGHKLRS